MDGSSLLMLERVVQMLWHTIQVEKQRWLGGYCYNRQYSNANQPMSTGRGRPLCSYCGRKGHVFKNCRRRLQACFVCGSPEHKLRMCPSRDSPELMEAGKTTEDTTVRHRVVLSSQEEVQGESKTGTSLTNLTCDNFSGIKSEPSAKGSSDRLEAIECTQERVKQIDSCIQGWSITSNPVDADSPIESNKRSDANSSHSRVERAENFKERSQAAKSLLCSNPAEVYKEIVDVLPAQASLDQVPKLTSITCKGSQQKIIRSSEYGGQAFNDVTMKPNECVFLYRCRLENAYRSLYPNKEVSSSKVLLEKFTSTCPIRLAKFIKKCRKIKRASGHELKWKHIGRVLKMYQKEESDTDLSSISN